jgi:hypothetical protein
MVAVALISMKREHGGGGARPEVTEEEEEASCMRGFKGGRVGKEKSARQR